MQKENSLTEYEKNYLWSIYEGASGFVKFMSGNNRKGIYPPAKSLRGDYLTEVINSNRLTDVNLMCSIATYYEKGKATMDNIHSICCLPIDIDYKFEDEKGKLLEPLLVLEKLKDDILEKCIWFPQPTYVEYGHRLRLIYIFESPVIMPKSDKKKRKGTMKWLHRIMQEICNEINKMDPLYNAETHKLTSFVRVPSSINIKYKPVFEKGQKIPAGFVLDENYVINIIPIVNCRKWDIHELSDFVLPDLPDWYETYKERYDNKKKDEPEIHISGSRESTNQMLLRRMEFLRVLQELGYDEGCREKMCFLYWNFALQSGMTKKEAREAVKQFNKQFVHPLVEKEMLSHSYPRKLYKYSMKTVLTELDVPKEIADKYGFSYYNRREYQKRYMREYRKYKKIKEYNPLDDSKVKKSELASKAKELRDEGLKIKEIADEIGVSESTVKRYIVKEKNK